MTTVLAGAAAIDVTPPVGLAMSGFAARTSPATGTHDRLTVRAVAVDDTAIVVADVIGLHQQTSERVRRRAVLPAERIITAALHTHGGPVSMPGMLGASLDDRYLARLEDAMVAAIDEAVASRRPARLSFGEGTDPRVARNRRHPDGPVDPHVPVLRVQALDGRWIAIVTSYACHPVVLGADNTAWTADYPHYVRTRLEAEHPGALALFLTGCTADANTGHSAHASISLAANANRTFSMAEQVGLRIAESALAAPSAPVGAGVAVANETVRLRLTRREREPAEQLAARWREEAQTADPARAALLGIWARWAEGIDADPRAAAEAEIEARVTAFMWGGVPIVALPGEIFAETALAIRAGLRGDGFVIGFCEANPGYIPPRSEFPYGGYEVEEAHRYYGMPATFAPGSAELLAECALSLAERILGGGNLRLRLEGDG
jgi:neutral ceramidase